VEVGETGEKGEEVSLENTRGESHEDRERSGHDQACRLDVGTSKRLRREDEKRGGHKGPSDETI
jgi:hypothetical protein